MNTPSVVGFRENTPAACLNGTGVRLRRNLKELAGHGAWILKFD